MAHLERGHDGQMSGRMQDRNKWNERYSDERKEGCRSQEGGSLSRDKWNAKHEILSLKKSELLRLLLTENG